MRIVTAGPAQREANGLILCDETIVSIKNPPRFAEGDLHPPKFNI